jgi:signal transduction histidine kinase
MRTQRAEGAQQDILDRNLMGELKDILQKQRAISREIEVGRLIETLLTIAMDLESAKRGLPFLARGGELEVEAEATARDGSVKVAFSPASAASPGFPQTVLRYVLRMEESVALDDAVAENPFSDDDYLIRNHPRSILCLPLAAQRNLTGVLYLENAIAPGAFAPARLAALELLASQAAVSLRTAALGIDLTHEIKERQKAEAELERFHRMYGEAHLNARAELMTGLTAALSHELNQPLAAVRNNAEAAHCLLSDSKPDLIEVKAALGDIIRATSRIADMVQSVRAIFQRDAVEMTAMDLSQLLHDVSQIVSADAALQKIIVRLEVLASLPPVVGNRAQLIQALMNLTQNAFEAIDENNDQVREVEISARQCKPDRVHVAVRDSGKGIDPEIMPRLFDAFFTT